MSGHKEQKARAPLKRTRNSVLRYKKVKTHQDLQKMALKTECAGARRRPRWMMGWWEGAARSVNASLIKCPKRKHRYSSLLMDKVLHRPIHPLERPPHPPAEAPQESRHELLYSSGCFFLVMRIFFGDLQISWMKKEVFSVSLKI